VSRPALDENETPEETNSKLNSVRMDIIRRQYGQNKAGKEMIQVLKYWEILEMGVNLILSKPNSVSG